MGCAPSTSKNTVQVIEYNIMERQIKVPQNNRKLETVATTDESRDPVTNLPLAETNSKTSLSYSHEITEVTVPSNKSIDSLEANNVNSVLVRGKHTISFDRNQNLTLDNNSSWSRQKHVFHLGGNQESDLTSVEISRPNEVLTDASHNERRSPDQSRRGSNGSRDFIDTAKSEISEPSRLHSGSSIKGKYKVTKVKDEKPIKDGSVLNNRSLNTNDKLSLWREKSVSRFWHDVTKEPSAGKKTSPLSKDSQYYSVENGDKISVQSFLEDDYLDDYSDLGSWSDTPADHKIQDDDSGSMNSLSSSDTFPPGYQIFKHKVQQTIRPKAAIRRRSPTTTTVLDHVTVVH